MLACDVICQNAIYQPNIHVRIVIIGDKASEIDIIVRVTTSLTIY